MGLSVYFYQFLKPFHNYEIKINKIGTCPETTGLIQFSAESAWDLCTQGAGPWESR